MQLDTPPELEATWSYESQLMLVLLTSAVIVAISLYVVYRVRERLRRRAARRRSRRNALSLSQS